MRRVLGTYNLYLAWLVALVSMGGSLYFSEIAMFEPCRLCWYQRICMYPLVLLLGIAAYRNDRGIIPYARALAGIGLLIALWHYMEQKVPFLHDIAPCTVGVPCNTDYIDWLGFITIPFLALIGFTLISILLSFKSQDDEE